MLFKYVVSDTPSVDYADALHDIALLMSGETNLANLSANCNKVDSGFSDLGTPLTRPWTIEHIDGAAGVILKRGHSQDNTYTTWTEIRQTGTTNRARFTTMSDGTAGVRTNPSAYWNSSNSSYYGPTINHNLASGVFWLVCTDKNVALLDSAMSYSTHFFELEQIDPGYVWNLSDRNKCDMYMCTSFERLYCSKMTVMSGINEGLSYNTGLSRYWQHVFHEMRNAECSISGTYDGTYTSPKLGNTNWTLPQLSFAGMNIGDSYRNPATASARVPAYTSGQTGMAPFYGTVYKNSITGLTVLTVGIQGTSNYSYNYINIEI